MWLTSGRISFSGGLQKILSLPAIPTCDMLGYLTPLRSQRAIIHFFTVGDQTVKEPLIIIC